jgi:hypothetical protein
MATQRGQGARQRTTARVKTQFKKTRARASHYRIGGIILNILVPLRGALRWDCWRGVSLKASQQASGTIWGAIVTGRAVPCQPGRRKGHGIGGYIIRGARVPYNEQGKGWLVRGGAIPGLAGVGGRGYRQGVRTECYIVL